jgi:phosphorylated adapter RNA export protein
MIHFPDTQLFMPDRALIKHVAETLQEGNVTLIQKIIEVIGPERTQEFLQKTLEIEAASGITTKDSSRRRSPGGVFFYIVRTSLPKEERKRIWPQARKKKSRAATQDDTSTTVGSSTEPPMNGVSE